MLCGTTGWGGQYGAGTVFKLNRDASGHIVLHQFSFANGAWPRAGLIEGSDGALYGTASQGGQSNSGTVFKISRDGTGHTVLWHFNQSATGAYPHARLIEDSDGALYGTTYRRGQYDFGTVFRVNRDGSGHTVLRHFNWSTGAYPHAGLVGGSDGALYGTTYQGGESDRGTVFKINRDGTGHTVLHHFNYSDGANPYAGLVEGSDGALYGTTTGGGQSGYGVVFKINRDGSGHTVLHRFNYSDGAEPYAGLVEGSDGALFGTTYSGGQGGYGTVFKVNRDGSGHTVLHRFNNVDGWSSYAGLIEGSDGAFYGTTLKGGRFGTGTVFKINGDGSAHTVLHHFNYSDGWSPYAELIEGSDGAFYGTTWGAAPAGARCSKSTGMAVGSVCFTTSTRVLERIPTPG